MKQVFTACRRTTLLLAALLSLGMSVLFTLPAFAATVPTSAHPATVHGGGCGVGIGIQSCISEDVNHYIVPDAYAAGSALCGVNVMLYEDGTYLNEVPYSGCYGSGTHFSGQVVYGTPGHSWLTRTCAYVEDFGGNFCTESAVQYS